MKDGTLDQYQNSQHNDFKNPIEKFLESRKKSLQYLNLCLNIIQFALTRIRDRRRWQWWRKRRHQLSSHQQFFQIYIMIRLDRCINENIQFKVSSIDTEILGEKTITFGGSMKFSSLELDLLHLSRQEVGFLFYVEYFVL